MPSCPTRDIITGLLREQNVQARNCSSEKVLGKSFLPRFIYIYKTLEQSVCLHIGLGYPDMYNLPILSDYRYVKFLRQATLTRCKIFSGWHTLPHCVSPLCIFAKFYLPPPPPPPLKKENNKVATAIFYSFKNFLFM